jgi:uncharacterized protein YndB with AHSA1/START domain
MSEAQHEISIDLILDAPRDKVFRCWTEAELIKQWFAPKPWSTPHAEVDVRPGGGNKITMRSPEGQEFPSEGVYLDIVKNERIVFTDAFTAGYTPAGKPFFVGRIELSDAGPGKTRYVARAQHWNEETRAEHEKMGFVPGWTQCAKQLEELAKTL